MGFSRFLAALAYAGCSYQVPDVRATSDGSVSGGASAEGGDAGGAPIDAGEAGDAPNPDCDGVVLLMHFDGQDRSTSFVDVMGHAVTAQGAARLSTANPKFGPSSGVFPNPTSVAYLTVAPSPDWDLTSGDSTVEMWAYLEAVANEGAGTLLSQSPVTLDGQWMIDVQGSSMALNVQQNGGGASHSSSGGIVRHQWQHLAVVREAAQTTLFVDGVPTGPFADDFYTASGNALYVAAANTSNFGGAYCWSGYIDELRITKGVARYASKFTPPAAPFPDCP